MLNFDYLRRFLARVLFGKQRPGPPAVSRVMDEIAGAVVDMARVRQGAIIVIEQRTGLEDVIENGVRLDALVSAVLLKDIFCPNAPLHDKAVIIRGDRIVAAACPLPTANGVAAAKLGMRHKAGLGISELTDAIAVVVSEERGTVSIGYGGHLLQLEDPAEIRFALYELAEKGRDADLLPAFQVA